MTTATNPSPPAARRWLSVRDAAAYASVSAETIRRWLAAGHLTGYRPGRRVLIDPIQLDAYIRAHAE
jgi:excisionase family DNA binding protein